MGCGEPGWLREGVGVRWEEKGERAAATGIGLPGSRTLQQRRRKIWMEGRIEDLQCTFFVIKHNSTTNTKVGYQQEPNSLTHLVNSTWSKVNMYIWMEAMIVVAEKKYWLKAKTAQVRLATVTNRIYS